LSQGSAQRCAECSSHPLPRRLWNQWLQLEVPTRSQGHPGHVCSRPADDSSAEGIVQSSARFTGPQSLSHGGVVCCCDKLRRLLGGGLAARDRGLDDIRTSRHLFRHGPCRAVLFVSCRRVLCQCADGRHSGGTRSG
ncbi:unnamed protein product, partial [Ixodes persulcatus]